MGFFDRLFGRKSEEEKNSGEPSISAKTFLKFQEETRDGMRHMRGEFNKLVTENHTLKKQVLSVTKRLDAIQYEQLQQRNETKKGLSDLSKSIVAIVDMGGKAKPDIPEMNKPQADAQAVQPLTQKRLSQVVAPIAETGPKHPSRTPIVPSAALDAPKPPKRAPEAGSKVDDQADHASNRMVSAQIALSSLNSRLTEPSLDAPKPKYKPN